MAAFSSLQGICYLRVGKIFLWIEYGLVMFINFIITPVMRNKPQDAHSIWGIIRGAVKEFLFTTPYSYKVVLFLILTIAFLIPAYLLSKRQKVTW